MTDTRPDSDREPHNVGSTEQYPCLKCYATIDAPLEDVCAFLADSRTVPQYNGLVDDHADVEEISPSGKVTWCKAPQILFVKPRDFVTYCSHRWRRDGSQVIVNQAVDHEDRPGVMEEGRGNGGACRGFAIRGANSECLVCILSVWLGPILTHSFSEYLRQSYRGIPTIQGARPEFQWSRTPRLGGGYLAGR